MSDNRNPKIYQAVRTRYINNTWIHAINHIRIELMKQFRHFGISAWSKDGKHLFGKNGKEISPKIKNKYPDFIDLITNLGIPYYASRDGINYLMDKDSFEGHRQKYRSPWDELKQTTGSSDVMAHREIFAEMVRQWNLTNSIHGTSDANAVYPVYTNEEEYLLAVKEWGQSGQSTYEKKIWSELELLITTFEPYIAFRNDKEKKTKTDTLISEIIIKKTLDNKKIYYVSLVMPVHAVNNIFSGPMKKFSDMKTEEHLFSHLSISIDGLQT